MSISRIESAITVLCEDEKITSVQNMRDFVEVAEKIKELNNALCQVRLEDQTRASKLLATLKNTACSLFDNYRSKLEFEASNKIKDVKSREELLDFENWESVRNLKELEQMTLATYQSDIMPRIRDAQSSIEDQVISEWDKRDTDLTPAKRKNAERTGLAVGLTILLIVVAIGLMTFCPPAAIAIGLAGAIMSPSLGFLTVGLGLCSAYCACDSGVKGGRCTGNGVKEALIGAVKGLVLGIPFVIYVGLMLMFRSGSIGSSSYSLSLSGNEKEYLKKKFEDAQCKHLRNKKDAKNSYSPKSENQPEKQLTAASEKKSHEVTSKVFPSPLAQRSVVSHDVADQPSVRPVVHL